MALIEMSTLCFVYINGLFISRALLPLFVLIIVRSVLIALIALRPLLCFNSPSLFRIVIVHVRRDYWFAVIARLGHRNGLLEGALREHLFRGRRGWVVTLGSVAILGRRCWVDQGRALWLLLVLGIVGMRMRLAQIGTRCLNPFVLKTLMGIGATLCVEFKHGYKEIGKLAGILRSPWVLLRENWVKIPRFQIPYVE